MLHTKLGFLLAALHTVADDRCVMPFYTCCCNIGCVACASAGVTAAEALECQRNLEIMRGLTAEVSELLAQLDAGLAGPQPMQAAERTAMLQPCQNLWVRLMAITRFLEDSDFLHQVRARTHAVVHVSPAVCRVAWNRHSACCCFCCIWMCIQLLWITAW
jgi:hypothetical protein